MIALTTNERARGHWMTILPELGIDTKFLKRKNGPCPMCGGKDRWRFTDLDGKGTWWCNNCAGGNGIALAMKFTGIPFKELAQRIDRIIGGGPVSNAKLASHLQPANQQNRAALNRLWQSARFIEPDDPVDRWLDARGVGIGAYPACLRYGLQVRHSGPPVSFHPAMLAMVTAVDGKPATIHKTYVTIDGKKATVDKARMFCPGPRPAGGAVRLAPPADGVIGVAEGIETAFAAAKLFDIPTWSALDAGGVERFEPPVGITRLIVFGDNDEHGAGQRAAYALAARLSGQMAVDVKIPEVAGTDWNDVLLGSA